MSVEKCLYCKHRHVCKVLVNKRWVWFSICTALCDGSNDEFAMVVDECDMCEMFERREKNDGKAD